MENNRKEICLLFSESLEVFSKTFKQYSEKKMTDQTFDNMMNYFNQKSEQAEKLGAYKEYSNMLFSVLDSFGQINKL